MFATKSVIKYTSGKQNQTLQISKKYIFKLRKPVLSNSQPIRRATEIHVQSVQ